MQTDLSRMIPLGDKKTVYFKKNEFSFVSLNRAENNKSYLEGGSNSVSKTLIPDNTIGGSHNTFDSVAPVYEKTFIDINTIAY